MEEGEESAKFVERLQYVLAFLSENGFDKAASAVYEALETSKAGPEGDGPAGAADEPGEAVAEVQAGPEYGPHEVDHAQEYRSISADPVLQGSRGASQAGAEDAEDSQSNSPWPPGAAEGLQTRLSGSSRLYEDPDVDEYGGMDDVGYMRRSITNQQDFVMSQLDFLRTNEDECYFHSGSLQHGGSSSLQRADSCSNSSSASLSSPGMSTCAQQEQQDQQEGTTTSSGHVPDPQQQQKDQAGATSSSAAVTGDAAWDSGPAGITFAEPVTTPTKDSLSQRGSISDLQPSLSRVESLSNSFIEEFESVDGAAGGAEGEGHSRQASEAGSTAGDLGTPPRRSRGEGSSSDAGGSGPSGQQQQDPRASDPSSDVIDLSPPSPPPDCAADGGIDLSNIFELGLRASSRTSSVDVLQGSVRCYSEPDLSEALFGQQQQLDTGRAWASSYSATNSGCGSASSSRANSSLGIASLGGPGGLVIKPRQSAGASRLQSASQHDPEQDAGVELHQQQPEQVQEQQQQEAIVPEQGQQPSLSIKQQQDVQQPPRVEDAVLVLSPTHEQQQDACAALTFSPPKEAQQHKQQQQQQQQLSHGGGASDSGSSSSTAGPVTPTTAGTTIAASSSDASAAAAADAVDAATATVAAAAAAAAATAAAAAGGDAPCLSVPSAEASAADVGAVPAAAADGTSSFSCAPVASGTPGGFGFTFPTTPPSAVDAAVHEERAERVFSTWASNHSRSLSGALDLEFAAAEDADADTSSSRPPHDNSTAAEQEGQGAAADFAAAPWGFPALAVPAVEEPSTSGAAAAAGAEGAAAAAEGSSSSPKGPEEIILVAPVSPGESPFLAGAALASCSKNSSPAGKALSRGGSRAHSSSSAAGRAAAAGNSSSSSSRRLSAAGRQQQQQQQQVLATSSGGARSPLGDGAVQGPAASGPSASSHLLQQGSAGYDALGNALIPGLDADAESTGGFSGSGELSAPRYVIDEAGNLLYEYDTAYIENRYETFELRIIHRRRRTGFEDSKEFPIRKNDLIAGRYQVMDFLGSAAFSQAVQALDVATGALVCLKIIKNNKDYFDQSLDEIKLLRYVNNEDPDDEHHIVRLYDFFYYKEHLILVCELLRANLYEFQKYQRENGDDPYFTPPRIQRIAIQVLQSLAFLHSLGLVHSDLKPENILIKSYSRCEVKVIDLGSSCFITDHLSSYVQSRSYRAPEVILGLPYGQKIDIWSLGCILAELATGYVLFQNDSLATLLARLEGILGPLPSWMVAQGRYSNRYYTRSRQLYERSKASGRYELLLPKHTSLRHRVPAADEGFLDFLSYLLTADPSARPSATEALQHPWLSFPYPPVREISD